MDGCTVIILGVLLSVMTTGGGATNCQMEDDTCEFWLTIEHHLTMMSTKYAVFPANGKLFRYNETNTTLAIPMSPDGVTQADGYEPQRLVTLANGTMPGPDIEVYEGQTVIVHVLNKLYNEGVTIHWHGIHQTGTPFMDGVAFVTQCPIMPGQSFTYKFQAKPKGTFWYHSHIGNQRTMGLFGALIIREKKPLEMEELILTVQDWNHDDSSVVHLKMNFGGFVDRQPISTTDSLDGSHFSRFFMLSGLINGRGRLYTNGEHNGAPLTVFNVDQNKRYRFRVISAGHLYPFRLSVDGHELTLVASDGYDLQPVVAESFVINPGERFDFIINTTNNVDNYWIRAQTLEVKVDHKAEAILRYTGASGADPTSNRKTCTQDDPCLIINCPFTYWPENNTVCMTFDQLKSLNNDPAPPVQSGKFKEYFLNFAFPGISHYPGQVNGRAFVMPSVSSLTQPLQIDHRCEDEDCGDDKTCHCSYSLGLTHGDTVQMVFLNMGRGKGWAHPIHMHGHSFYVLKMGYARYNETNGRVMDDNEDVDCGGDPSLNFCNNARWVNSSWNGGNVPEMELVNPPRKDTIIVPSGGYVVLRIRADNPGVWFMHCHIEMHAQDGMAMMINESFPYHPAPPNGWQKCSSFGPEVTFSDTFSDKPVDSQAMYDSGVFWTVVGCLIAVCVLQFLIIGCMCCRQREQKKELHASSTPQHNKGFDRY